MVETKKTLEIMKARWQEVLVIVGLHVLGMVAINRSFLTNSDSLGVYRLLLSLFSFAVLIISTILSYGFLRTVHLEGMNRQMPAFLFGTGKKFFWRMLKFQILCMLVFLPFVLIKIVIAKSEGPGQPAPWIPSLLSTVPSLILIKPLLLIPALIIVMDCRVRESWQFMLRIKLLDAKEIVVLFCVMLAIGFFGTIAKAGNSGEVGSQNIFSIIPTVIIQILGLIISIMAVRFVACREAVHDSNAEQARETLDGDRFEE